MVARGFEPNELVEAPRTKDLRTTGLRTSGLISFDDERRRVRESESKNNRAPTTEDTPELLKDLGDEDFSVRESARRTLLAMGLPALPALRKCVTWEGALSHDGIGDLERERGARRLISKIQDAALPGLIEALGDEDWKIRQDAQAQLVTIGLPGLEALHRVVARNGALEEKAPADAERRRRAVRVIRRVEEQVLEDSGTFGSVHSGELRLFVSPPKHYYSVIGVDTKALTLQGAFDRGTEKFPDLGQKDSTTVFKGFATEKGAEGAGRYTVLTFGFVNPYSATRFRDDENCPIGLNLKASIPLIVRDERTGEIGVVHTRLTEREQSVQLNRTDARDRR